MTDDIAARLRMYANASIDGGWASVFRADLNIAADEIERLREALTASHESHGNEVGALTERLALAIHERDEARREVLEKMHPDLRKGYAAAREWDCFKEASDER